MKFINGHEEVPGHTTLEDGSPRRTFTVAGNEVTAASLIMSRKNKEGILEFLLVEITTPKGNQWQSLGGKVMPRDLHWKHTALREFLEETGYTLDGAHSLCVLQSAHATVVYRKQSRHAYMFLNPICSPECQVDWAKINKKRMSKADAERVVQVKWVDFNAFEEANVRPDVKSVILFFVEALKKQNNEQEV